MSLSPAEVWNRLLDRARQELPDQTFQAWLEPTEALSIEGNILFVGAPDQFTADWNDSKHATLLSSFGPIVLGYPMNVVFRVNEERKKRSQMDFFVAPPPIVTNPAPTQSSTSSPPLSQRYTFDLFVIGKSNELAAAAAHAVSQAPGKVYNPLFIYGDTGLGKTHLIQAIAHDTLERNSGTRITYVAAEQFMNELISAIGERAVPGAHRHGQRLCDVAQSRDLGRRRATAHDAGVSRPADLPGQQLLDAADPRDFRRRPRRADPRALHRSRLSQAHGDHRHARRAAELRFSR